MRKVIAHTLTWAFLSISMYTKKEKVLPTKQAHYFSKDGTGSQICSDVKMYILESMKYER